MPKLYNYKIKITGDISEITQYDIGIMTDYQRKHNTPRKEGRTMANEQNVKRARKKVHDLVHTNWTEHTKMLTLTYAKTQLDYDILSKDYKTFLLYLKRHGFEFPYLSITEHQTKRGKKEGNAGSLHIHALLFTDNYIPFSEIKKAWGKRGSVHIEKIDKAKNKGAYVAKYISKETMPPDRKAYRTSRHIKRPEIISGLDAQGLLMQSVLNDKIILEQYDYSIMEETIQDTGEVVERNHANVTKYKTDKNWL